MSDTVIHVEQLGKRYRIGHQRQENYVALRDVLAHNAKSITRWFGVSRPVPIEQATKDFWALKDVSFEVKRGDRVGIIGRNGAGKSTLLKILSRITEPTEGRIRLKGRVASLLEVGTGFHPELTGRENIYLNGAILGMSRQEIQRKFDEIVAFAEVETFLDTPVKRYSSGMYVRLAFAVAAHLEPEILIVDEVLAVGDAAFQKKCLGKMEDVGQSGRTVFFVSHNMSAIQTLCNSCICLQQGKVKHKGAIDDAIQLYLGDASSSDTFSRTLDTAETPKLQTGKITVLTPDNPQYVQLDVEIYANQSHQSSLDVRLTDATGKPVGFGSLGALRPSEMIEVRAHRTAISIQFYIGHLANGNYYLSLDLTRPKVRYYDRLENCLSFNVERKLDEAHGQSMQQSWQLGALKLDISRI